MKKRLIERGQAELYNSNMISWLKYLRKEAIDRNKRIIDTDKASKEEIGQMLMKALL